MEAGRGAAKARQQAEARAKGEIIAQARREGQKVEVLARRARVLGEDFEEEL